MWKLGDRLTHRHNPELGLGQVVAVDARTVTVAVRPDGRGPAAGGHLDAPCQPVDLRPGRRVRVLAARRRVAIAAHRPGRARCGWRTAGSSTAERRCGRSSSRARSSSAWPWATSTRSSDFAMRLDALHLAERARGGRPRLVPRRAHPPLPAPAPRRRARHRSRPRALAAGRRGGPGQDGRGLPDPEPPRAHAAAPSAAWSSRPGP